MAKKTRIDRRGTIRPLVKRFPPVRGLYWKKQKLLAILNFRRRYDATKPHLSDAIEIITEAGVYVITQSSSDALPNYIITE